MVVRASDFIKAPLKMRYDIPWNEYDHDSTEYRLESFQIVQYLLGLELLLATVCFLQLHRNKCILNITK